MLQDRRRYHTHHSIMNGIIYGYLAQNASPSSQTPPHPHHPIITHYTHQIADGLLAPSAGPCLALKPGNIAIAGVKRSTLALIASGTSSTMLVPVGYSLDDSVFSALADRAEIASMSETATLYDGFEGSPRAGPEPPGGSMGTRRQAARSSHMNLLRRVLRSISLWKLDWGMC